MGLLLPVRQAFPTNGNIRSHLCDLIRFRMTGCNGKIGIVGSHNLCFCHLDRMDHCDNWMFLFYTGNEPITLFRSQDSTYTNTVIPVINFPFYLHLVRDTIDKRTKANALH